LIRPLSFSLLSQIPHNSISAQSTWWELGLGAGHPARVCYRFPTPSALVRGALTHVTTGSMADVPKDLLQQIKEFEDIFTVDRAKLKEIVNHFVKELEKGMV
jgi:hypothetical protein